MKFIRKVTKEIIIQGNGNAFKQGNIDVILMKNPMDMWSSATDVLCQLGGRNAMLAHYLLDMLPDVHEKAWNLFNLLAIGFPRPLNNKLFHANAGVS